MKHKQYISLLIGSLYFVQTKAQGSIWVTYCERNIFYNNGNYFGVLGLIRLGDKNDTFNIKSHKERCTIVSGKWKVEISKSKEIHSNFRQ